MPFKSEQQRRFMYAKHPGIARRWTAEEKKVHKSADSRRTYRRIARAEGRATTRKKAWKRIGAANAGAAAGLAAPIAVAVGGRGVSAARGARYARNTMPRYMGRPTPKMTRNRMKIGAKGGFLFGQNRKTEIATLNPVTLGASSFTGQTIASNRSTRKSYPGYKADMWSGGLKPVKQKVKKNMTISVWGVDHGEEVHKVFKPILGAKPNPQVAQGLRQVQSLPKPMAVPKPPTQPGLSRAAGVQRFGNSQTGALASRLKARSQVTRRV
jgi:hypothetical protein